LEFDFVPDFRSNLASDLHHKTVLALPLTGPENHGPLFDTPQLNIIPVSGL
jgi:hypothetical protein